MRDISPLAYSIPIKKAMAHSMDFETWYKRVQEVLCAQSFIPVPELIFLLEAGFDYNLDELGPRSDKLLDQTRRRLKLYISILTGLNHQPDEEWGEGMMSAWSARREVEVTVLRLLTKHVFAQPEDMARLCPKNREDPRFNVMIRMINGWHYNFFKDLWDREILNLLFLVFDPANQTSMQWWKKTQKSPEQHIMGYFGRWFLDCIWSKHWAGSGELAVSARRRTLRWIARTDYYPRVEADDIPLDLWQRLYVRRLPASRRGHLRQVPKKLRTIIHHAA